ncbi:hypothetical protein MALGJ_02710 [Mycolicibacter algericus]|uniref:Uncharacterized protein n=1 Tax=Mycolicibacter algericus TaxID=1288388 RepID=A0A7I9Y4J3_MYCAL|nr:hypothetical protein MALGJ_02710 [Mycolicibacter algericus]
MICKSAATGPPTNYRTKRDTGVAVRLGGEPAEIALFSCHTAVLAATPGLFDSDALEAISACDGLESAFHGIGIPKHKARYGSAVWPPHRVTLGFLCQSLNGMALRIEHRFPGHR